MRNLVYLCAIAIFIAVLIPGAAARVLGSDLSNSVAVYYFDALTDAGTVPDSEWQWIAWQSVWGSGAQHGLGSKLPLNGQ